MRRRDFLAGLMSTPMLPAMAASPRWPSDNKAVRIIINTPPGSALDIVTRLMAAELQQRLSATLVLESRTGAGGYIGAEAVAKAPGDGLTLLASPGSLTAIGPHIYSRTTIDPNKELTPVASLGRAMLFLVVPVTSPAKTISEFLDYGRRNPGKLAYGSAGNGTSPHLAGELFKSMTGFDATHIPFKGTTPVLQELQGQRIDYAFDAGGGIEHIRSGKLRLLAVANLSRSTVFPEIPTLHEAGLTNFDAGTSYGIYAPAATNKDVVQSINHEINAVLDAASVRERTIASGTETSLLTPQEFARLIREDSDRFRVIVREKNIRAD